MLNRLGWLVFRTRFMLTGQPELAVQRIPIASAVALSFSAVELIMEFSAWSQLENRSSEEAFVTLDSLAIEISPFVLCASLFNSCALPSVWQ